MLAGACSSSEDESAVGDAGLATATPSPDDTVTSSGDVETSSDAAAAPTTTQVVVESDEPVVRVQVNEDEPAQTNWVARTFMDSERVEVVWSPVDGALQYQLYRLPTVDADYAAIDQGILGDATRVYEGPEFGFIDEDVPAGQFLTYVLVAEVGEGVTTPRWTEALTVPDATPPTPIENLEATVTEDGVLLSWSPSIDDVEFAAYSVVTLVEDGTWQYIGGGSEEGQTSFLDTEPGSGINTYQVRAFDFHDNGSDPAMIEVDVP